MAMACPLRSTSITLASSLLRGSPPLSGASVLSARDAFLENCFFYISRLYEFLHGLGHVWTAPARWQALGLVPAGLLSAGARALTPVPPAVPGEAHRSTQTASVLRHHTPLADAQAFAAYLASLRKTEWVVYSKPPFGGPEAVLAYLSRYTHRVAIANSRLIAFDEDSITF